MNTEDANESRATIVSSSAPPSHSDPQYPSVPVSSTAEGHPDAVKLSRTAEQESSGVNFWPLSEQARFCGCAECRQLLGV